MTPYGSPGAPAFGWTFANQQIAYQARSYGIGTWQGQCKVFAGNVVNAVLSRNGISARVGGYGTPGGAYYGAYERAGGVLVGVNDAQPGDLIQTINAASKNSDSPPLQGLHTAIVVARTATAGTYVVRDSNWGLDERVAEHNWSPATWAQSRNAAAYVWRFGTADTGGDAGDTAPGPGDRRWGADFDGDGKSDVVSYEEWNDNSFYVGLNRTGSTSQLLGE